ncbi:Ankyrin repeats-containing protein [Candidatus Trichorickettsia mobilis]|uniref:Ankyrin repeats-containing protein n=1 Tax=Candidatus Trichorickettsia mobilis TaxID=1346319 RepID=A0ABZ0UQG7_9RICK|nr:hypothetical protein [Candidatus Trichorickettsia mobilis]WPY00285.1 Ankyrin repeats-containing protein [Candidatus Trichorickettsia mobilis]
MIKNKFCLTPKFIKPTVILDIKAIMLIQLIILVVIISTNAIAGESLKLPELPALPNLEEQDKDEQKQKTTKVTANTQQDDAPGFFRKITNFLGITSKKTSAIKTKSSKKNTNEQEEPLSVELEQNPTSSNATVNNKPLTTAKEELKIPSLPPVDLPALPPTNTANAQTQAQPQLPTIDNQNNQPLPKTEITQSNVQSLPLPNSPKDVQTDKLPATTKPDAEELKIPSLPPSDNSTITQLPIAEQAKDISTTAQPSNTLESSNTQPSPSSDNSTTAAPAATNNIANENDELQSPPPLTSDKSKSARDTILGWFKSKNKEEYQAPAPQQTPILDKKPITIEKIVIDNQELTLEQSKFVNDETKVLLLPNDDIVLGELSEEAKILLMDLYSYSKLLKQIQDKNDRTIEREAIDNFILNYDSYFNTTPVLTIDDARIDAFNNVKHNNLFALRTLLDNYHVLQNTDENGNTLLHKTAELDSYFLTKFLLMRGINIQALNTDYQTALTIAEEQQNDAITRLIRKSGAR